MLTWLRQKLPPAIQEIAAKPLQYSFDELLRCGVASERLER